MRVIDTNGNLKQTPGAPIDANYLTWISGDATLTNDRILTIGDGLSMSYTIPGTTFVIGGRGWNKIGLPSVASSSATIEFTGLGDTSYVGYCVALTNVQPATDNTILRLRTSTDNGSSYDSGASDYTWSGLVCGHSGGVVSGNNDAADSEIELSLATGIGNATNETISLQVMLFDPNASAVCNVTWCGLGVTNGANPFLILGNARRVAAADVTAIQFSFSSGNIASGQFDLYGLAY